ncbi:hypothetical protein V5799_010243 [Amblyomma americanum]|uniref:Uncharacterized protein n=1 Tax=Amblyomma americanum TaxID=6943 RepID=A0AAQ4F9L6_AMBAM
MHRNYSFIQLEIAHPSDTTYLMVCIFSMQALQGRLRIERKYFGRRLQVLLLHFRGASLNWPSFEASATCEPTVAEARGGACLGQVLAHGIGIQA